MKKMFIGGSWVESHRARQVRNPFDGSLLAEVAEAGPAEVERALASAEQGARIMAAFPAHARAELLLRAATRVREEADTLAQTLTLESGKPIRESRAEVRRAAETLALSGEEAKRLYGETLPMDADRAGVGKLGFTLRVPMGVVLAITPFNFPLNLVCHKVGPALAAGNAVILKPAEETPLSALALTEILLEAGLPPLALQCILGAGEVVGPPLVADPRVRMISFTGSRGVGKEIAKGAGLKKLTLELGSSSPLLVLPDADPERVAQAAVAQGFANAGQVCISAQRLLVAESLSEAFVDALRGRIRRLKVGDPLLDDTVVGPMIRAADAARVHARIEEAKAAGAHVLEGGGYEGNLHFPTLVTGVTAEMRIAREELFGPAMALTLFKSVEEAIDLANATPYGLSAGVYTNRVDWALAAARGIEAGNVMINGGPQWRADFMPYGGLKGSGLGKEGPRYAIQELTESKTILFH